LDRRLLPKRLRRPVSAGAGPFTGRFGRTLWPAAAGVYSGAGLATAAAALVASTALAVALGTSAAQYLSMVPLKLIAGLGFVAIGAWTIYGHFQAG
jgi:hypothetical protein